MTRGRARLAALWLGGLAAAGCSRGDAKTSDPQLPHASIEEIGDSNLIAIQRPDLFPLTTAELRSVADHLSGTCVVSPDVNRSVPVNALGAGRVTELRAKLGDHVEQGQTLVVITSPDLASALNAQQHAVADELLARKQLDRSKVLLEHGSIARKDLEVAQDAHDKALADLRTTTEQVRLLGGDPDHPSPQIEVKAPISGTIIQQGVAPGAGVKSPDNAPNLFSIADLSQIWVLCDVYENDLPRVQVGSVATVRLNAYPDRAFTGRVANIAPMLDSATRTAKVRVELSNPGGVMRLGMFATADLVSPWQNERLVVPASAVLRMHDADWVFVKTARGQFRRTLVEAGPSVGARMQQVIGGLSPRDSIVRDALQFAQSSAKN